MSGPANLLHTGQQPGNHTEAVVVDLSCPNCHSSDDLASIEAINGTCRGRAELQIQPDGGIETSFTADGYTDIDWNTTTTIGICCRHCLWSHVGEDYLQHLTTAIPESL